MQRNERLYLVALLPRSIHPYFIFLPPRKPLFSCLSLLFLSSPLFFSALLRGSAFFVIQSFGRQTIHLIYHISLVTKGKHINHTVALWDKRAISHKIIVQELRPGSLLTCKPPKLLHEDMEMKACVLSEQMLLEGVLNVRSTRLWLTGHLAQMPVLANVGASCIAILSNEACRKSTKGSSEWGQEIHSVAYLAKVGLLKRDLSLPTTAPGPGPGLWSAATLVEKAEGCTGAEILCLSAKTSALSLPPLVAWLPSQAKATVKILSGHRKHLCSDLARKS